MAQAKGITRAEEAPQEAPKQENMALLMVKMMLRDPSMLMRLRRRGPDEERYVAPPRMQRKAYAAAVNRAVNAGVIIYWGEGSD